MRLFFLPDKVIHILINASPAKKLLLIGGGAVGFGMLPILSLVAITSIPNVSQLTSSDTYRDGAVLAAETEDPNFIFNVNVPSFFNDTVTFGSDAEIKGGLTVRGKAVFANGIDFQGSDLDLGVGKVIASNIIYSVTAGEGISVAGEQTPTITNTGVLSIQGKSGKLDLVAGDGISIDGLKITATNSDSDTEQDVFKTISVSGQSDVTAGSATDTLTFEQGTGITLTTDPTTKKLTITANGGGVSGLASLDGLTGIVTISNTSGSGSTITIDDASTAAKGIASFNSTNFSVSSGVVNLIQNIDTSASPTFTGLTLSSLTTNGGLVYTNGSGAVSQLSAGTSGYVLTSNGAGAAPSWIAMSATDRWQENLGAISPKNITDSLNLGNIATASALTHLAATLGDKSFFMAGNVGIGTRNPLDALEVNGNIRSSDGTFVAQIKGDSGGPRIQFGDTGDVSSLMLVGAYSGVNNIDSKSRDLRIFNTNDTTGLTFLASNGNFGIGSTSPNEKLDVNGRLYLSDGSAPGTTTNRLYAVSGGLYWNGNQINGLTSSQWTTSGSNIYYNTGNVGIGTTSITNPFTLETSNSSPTLSLAKMTNTHASGKAAYEAVNDSGAWASFGVHGSGFSLNLGSSAAMGGSNSLVLISDAGVTSGGTNSIQFRTGGANSTQEKMRIDSVGNVGIGTTAPIGLLNVSGGPTGKSLMVLNQTGNQDILSASTSGVTKFRINNSGQLYIADGSAPSTTTNMLYAVSGSIYWNGSQLSTVGGAGSTQWTTTGSDIYYNTGNVGIGTTTASLGKLVIIGMGSGKGIYFDQSSTSASGVGLYDYAAEITSGKGIQMTGSASVGTASNFTGKYIEINPSRDLSGAATRTDSGNFINLSRSNSVSHSSGIYNITGALATFSSNCTQTAGTCNDSSNILSLTQSYVRATGAALKITNNGLGAGLDLTSNSGGGAIAVLNSTGNSDLFTASSSGTTKFTIDNAGRLFLADASVPSPTTNKLYANGGDLYWNGVAITNGGGLDGASQWGTSGSAIYYNDGNVGIGTTNAKALLQVKGAVQADITDSQTSVDVAGLALTGEYGSTGGTLPGLVWSTSDNNATKPKAGIFGYADNDGSRLYFGTSNSYGTGITNKALVISPSGGLGVGLDTAQNSLMHLYGGTGVLLRLGNALSNVNDTSDIAFGSSTGTDWAKIGSIVEGTGDMGLAFYTTDDAGNDSTPERMRITHDGKVNIGSPTGSDGALNLNQDGVYSYNNGDSGRFIRFNTSGLYNDLLSGGERLVINWDGAQDTTFFENSVTGGNVGIGINPTARLHLISGDAGDTAYAGGEWLAKFYNQRDEDGQGGLVVGTRWYNQNTPIFSAGTICDSCGAAGFDTLFTVTGIGNVGIGTSNPAEKLDLIGAMHMADMTAPGDTTNKLYSESGTLYWNGIDLTAAAASSAWGLNGSKLYYTDGNVGIGTSDPASFLDVKGDFEDGGGSGLRIIGTDGHGSVLDIIQEGSNSWGIGMLPGDNSLGFFSNYSNPSSFDGERMRLDADGKLSLNTTDTRFTFTIDGAMGTVSEGDIFSQYDGNMDASNPIIARYWEDSATAYDSGTYLFGWGAGSHVGIEQPGGANITAFNVNADDSFFFGNAALLGNVGIGTTNVTNPLTVGSDNTNGNGAYVTVGGAWTNGSSREFKENFATLNQDDVLAKINSLSVKQWNYKNEDSSIKHIGPLAEDFYNTFNVGNDNKHISTIDPAGVALVGIQALSKQVEDLKAQIMTSSVSASFASTTESLGISDENATLSGDFTVGGRTTVNDLGVTGKLVSGLMAVDGSEGTINVVGDLKLQSNGYGKIDLFAGKVTIDNDGNMKTQGTITAKSIETDKLTLTTKDSSASAVLSASAGKIVIPAGQTSIDIKTSALTTDSLIFVTPEEPVGIGSKKKDTQTFTIKLQAAQSSDLTVNWWIVDAKTQ